MSFSKHTYHCPSCTIPIQFVSKHTTITICNHCNTTVLRQVDDSLHMMEGLYQLRVNREWLQPGSTGFALGMRFTLLGRLRVWFEEGICNYWTIVFENDCTAILSESYGLYAILMPTEVDEQTLRKRSFRRINLGQPEQLFDERSFVLERKNIANRWEIEGEVLYEKWPDKFYTYEFAAVTGDKLEIFNYGFTKDYVYTKYCFTVEELAFEQTRSANEAGKIENCQSCGQENTIKYWPYSQSFACKSCGAAHAMTGYGSYTLLGEKKKKKEKAHFTLEIGATGTIQNQSYEVIGAALKYETGAAAVEWTEYTLYNETKGFAFLSAYNGHWIFLKEANNAPVLLSRLEEKFEFDQQEYSLYNKYRFDTIASIGEFPNNIYNDNHSTEVKEYINPPFAWIVEKNGKEGINWYLAEHIDREKISKGFNQYVPDKVGIGMLEPKGYNYPMRLFMVTACIFIFAFLVHIGISTSKSDTILFKESYQIPDSLSTSTFTTPQFFLNKPSANLMFEAKAPVVNSWVSLDISLVNTKTGQEYIIEKGIEYYTGYDDGEPWSEGNQSETFYLSSIPSGTYFLKMIAMVEPYSKTKEVSLTVTYDTSMDKNFWTIAFIILIGPIVLALYTRYYERERWRYSDYSPYTYD